MEENKLHTLVNDLLPDYIEGLTSPETNRIIEEHLAKCPSCRETLERMKEKPFVLELDEKVEIDYLKTVRKQNRHRIWITICLVLLIVAGCFGTYIFLIGTKTPAALLDLDTTVGPDHVSLEVECIEKGRKVSRVSWHEQGGRIEAQVYTVPGNEERKTFSYASDSLIENVEVAGQVVWEDGKDIPTELSVLYENKVEYVGNVSKVSRLLEKMDVSGLIGSYTFALDDTRLIIDSARPIDDAYVDRESLLILSLIKNVSSVTWKSQGKEETVTTERMDDLLNTEIKEGYRSLVAFAGNVGRLEQSEEIWSMYVLDVQMEDNIPAGQQVVSFIVRDNGRTIEEQSGYIKDRMDGDGRLSQRFYLKSGQYTIQLVIDGEATEEMPLNIHTKYGLEKTENGWRLEK